MAQHLPPDSPPGWNTDTLWQRFRAFHPSAPEAMPAVVRRHRYRVSWVAAAALLIVGLAIGAGGRDVLFHSAQPFREFVTRAGNHATVVLHDGTRITLAPATRVRVPNDFGRGGARSVALDGEAYFEVVHDPAHPFAVRAGHTTIRDVGTAFDVRAYAEDRNVRVAVAEGEVCLGVAMHACEQSLHIGDVARIANTTLAVTHHADVTALTAWMQGRIVFADTPLSDAARTLERTFDIHIQIPDTALASAHVTGSFASDRMDEVLTAITTVVGAQYEARGHTVVILRRQTAATKRTTNKPVPLVTARADAGSASE